MAVTLPTSAGSPGRGFQLSPKSSLMIHPTLRPKSRSKLEAPLIRRRLRAALLGLARGRIFQGFYADPRPAASVIALPDCGRKSAAAKSDRAADDRVALAPTRVLEELFEPT